MVVEQKTIFVFHEGRVYPALEAWAQAHPDTVFARIVAKLANHVRNGRMLRGRQYMEGVATELFPDFQSEQMLSATVAGVLPNVNWQGAKEVVCVWPDANGMGWGPIERQIFRSAPTDTPVFAMNGRRRRWRLTPGTLIGLRWRRFLEKALVVELGFTLAFLFVTPLLVVYDRLRGRS
jgi:hypothetical protein